MIRHYSKLKRFPTFEQRFRYLVLGGEVGMSTFGFDRYLNQKFYGSMEWKRLRHEVIARDNGCDLGAIGYEIHHRPIIHHMNPMVIRDLTHGNDDILDPDFLITTTLKTHNAIHFGDERLLSRPFVDRKGGDTKLW